MHALGDLIGNILREQGGVALLATVEEDRVTAINRREGDAPAAELAARVRGRPPAQARDLVRAFSAWFQVVNLAEKVHRIRRRREYFLKDSGRPQPGGIEDALGALKAAGLTLADVMAILPQLQIQPVFTAHPTEATRRTMLRKQQRVAQLLLDRLDPTLTPGESRAVWNRVRAELTAAWQTEDHPRERLTVADEREHVLFYLGEVLYWVVPDFYEEVAEALEKLYGADAEALVLPRIIGFGTWVGGDMDGNPDVNGKTIRETLDRQNRIILSAYVEECQTSPRSSRRAPVASMFPRALAKRIDHYNTLVPGSRSITPARHDRMPYRVFLAQLGTRLRNALDGRPNGYEQAREFEADVQLIADSLRPTRAGTPGIIRCSGCCGGCRPSVSTWRRSMCASTPACITKSSARAWAIRSGWSARHRSARNFSVRRSGATSGPRAELDAGGTAAVGVFEAMVQGRHRYGPDAIGYYIVSGVRAAMMCSRCCCWRAGPRPRTNAPARRPWMLRRCLMPGHARPQRAADAGALAGPHLPAPSARPRPPPGPGARSCRHQQGGGICNARNAIHQAQRARPGARR